MYRVRIRPADILRIRECKSVYLRHSCYAFNAFGCLCLFTFVNSHFYLNIRKINIARYLKDHFYQSHEPELHNNNFQFFSYCISTRFMTFVKAKE